MLSDHTPVVITAIKEEATGVKTFFLAYADKRPIPYTAGQFITLVFEHHGREERRSFSISTAHAAGEQLAFTVKRIDNGAYSRLLIDKAQVGDTLYAAGVAGLFTLPQDISNRQLFFFAAGIGITPVFSLLKTALAAETAPGIVLVYSNRTEEDTVFRQELQQLKKQYSGRFEVVWLFSNAYDLTRARLNKALVKKLLSEYAKVSIPGMLFYVCGPFDYMRMVIYALEESGVQDGQIRRENFNMNSHVAIRNEPPDKVAHKVTFIHNGVAREISCQYPDTILKAALKQGINLPYSCEVGRCGSCAVRCIEGTVWHSYNEVLTDMDIRHGSVLTCTGYPVGGDVVIDV